MGIALCKVLFFLLVLLTGTNSLSAELFLYQRREETVQWGNHRLKNPFSDADLQLLIEAPPDRQPQNRFVFYGFHAGDGAGGQHGDVWKFRILLDSPGFWKVTARFIDPATGMVLKGAPQPPTYLYRVSEKAFPGERGHIRVDTNNSARLMFADGTPWVPFSIHSSMLLDRPFLVVKKWVDEHASLGVNALAVRFHSESEQIGGTPFYHFLGKDGLRVKGWPGSDDFDYSRFDLQSWAANEKIIEYVQDKGLKLSIWFGISGMNRQYWSYGPNDNLNDFTLGPQQKLFIKYFLARWAAYTAWWHWTIDSEYEETGKGALERVRAYAAEMHRLNPWDTLLTTHVLSDWTPEMAPELDIVTLQRRVPDKDLPLVMIDNFIRSNSGYERPVYNSEGVWHLSSRNSARIATIAHVMMGGFSHVAHFHEDHLMSSWGVAWDSVINRHKEDAEELGNLARFFNSGRFAINRAMPRFDIVKSNQRGFLQGFISILRKFRIFCLAVPQGDLLVWLAEGGQVEIDLTGFKGSYNVESFPGNKLDVVTKLNPVLGGKSVLLEPAHVSGASRDFFLLLRKVSD